MVIILLYNYGERVSDIMQTCKLIVAKNMKLDKNQ